MSSSPRDAGAIVLLRDDGAPQVYWAERSHRSAFLGGYHAFIGGSLDRTDGELASSMGRPTMVAAVRELFEETGVLVARTPRPLDGARLEAERKRLDEGAPFGAVLDALEAELDPELLAPAGRWLTPAFAPRRFDTHFFLARLPAGQQPSVRTAELEAGEWVTPADAVRRWEEGEVLLAPPVLHILRELARGVDDTLQDRLTAPAVAQGEPTDRIEFTPGVVLVPLRTATLPPATHTNAFVVGRERAVVIDPGAADPEELARLYGVIAELASEGVTVVELLLTHHHPDHVAGTEAVARKLGLPVAAHPETLERLELTGSTRALQDGDRIDLGAGYELTALATPGHAPGHLCFAEARTGAVITGDNVVGLGTVVIDPPEGDMDAYLESLERLRGLKARALFGGHGPAIATPGRRLDALIRHRLKREAAVRDAVAVGTSSLEDIAAAAYADTPRADPQLARRQTLAHLLRLIKAGDVREVDGAWLPA